MPNILLALTGSVAAIKLPQLHGALHQLGDVRVIVTSAAQKFTTLAQLPPDITILTDTEEANTWQRMGDVVLHIELRRWADVLVIAPLSANTLAKLAHGLSDNLVTCVARAWDWRSQPVVVAPAMNTLMWDSCFTREHLSKLTQLGAWVVQPVAKQLACGDVGVGGMAAPADISRVAARALAEGPCDTGSDASTQRERPSRRERAALLKVAHCMAVAGMAIGAGFVLGVRWQSWAPQHAQRRRHTA